MVTAVLHGSLTSLTAPGAAWAVVSGPRQQIQTGAAQPLRADAIFRIASITKPIIAVLTLALVDDGVFGLDDPIERWLPEFADRRVLRQRGGDLADTVAATRSTSIRDLLQMGLGLGCDMRAAPDDPLAVEIARREIASAWQPPPLSPDRWARAAGTLPMAHQPGEGWLYQFSFDALAVVIERAMRRRLDLVLRDRVLTPLDMRDTGYAVPMSAVDRVPAAWLPNRRGVLVEAAPGADPRLMSTPVFRSGATGLLSTAADLGAFAQMLLRGGRGPRGPIISPESFAALTTDTMTDSARAMAQEFLGPDLTWGLGVGVDLVARHRGSHPGRFGWNGGTGTSLWVDPAGQVAGVLLTRQGFGPDEPAHVEEFWRAVHA